MPIKSELQSIIKRDQILTGKVDFYEKGFTFTDERLGVFIMPFS